MRHLCTRLLGFAVLAGTFSGACLTPNDLLIVSVRGNTESEAVADAYCRAYTIPAAHRCEIDVPDNSTISSAFYISNIEAPVLAAVEKTQTKCVVLCYGIPWQIEADSPRPGFSPLTSFWASVDSQLAAKGRFRTSGLRDAPNPYFGSSKPFTRDDMLLVTRIDGASKEDALVLITRAQKKTHKKLYALIDMQPEVNGNNSGLVSFYNSWLLRTPHYLQQYGFTTHIDEKQNLVSSFDHPLSFYWGWYADPNGHFETNTYKNLEWAQGAVAVHVCSFGGRDLRRRLDAVAGLVHDGVAATLGTVYEPLIEGWARPDIFAAAYFAADGRGLTFAEAAWAATPYLSWQNIAVGDPLLRATKPVPADSAPATYKPGKNLPPKEMPDTYLPHPLQRSSK